MKNFTWKLFFSVTDPVSLGFWILLNISKYFAGFPESTISNFFFIELLEELGFTVEASMAGEIFLEGLFSTGSTFFVLEAIGPKELYCAYFPLRPSSEL